MRFWNARTRNWFCICLSLLMHSNCSRILAQAGRRPPTAEEKVVVDRYKNAVLEMLTPVANEDWEDDPTGDRDITDDYMVTMRPEVPFEITDALERSYHVTTGSPYYQRVMAPLIAQMQGTTDPQAMKNLFAHVDRTQLTIAVQFNTTDVSIDAEPPQLRNLVVPGAALAWQIQEDRQKKVTLLFGDWNTSGHMRGGLHYRFRQKGKHLSIENIVVELEGNGSRIDELLKTIDWKRMNATLSPAR